VKRALEIYLLNYTNIEMMCCSKVLECLQRLKTELNVEVV